MLSSTMYILIAMILVLFNAIFVAAEFGLVRLRSTQLNSIREIGSYRAKLACKIHQKLDVYLSACQLGITLTSLGLGWVGEPAFVELIMPILDMLKIESEYTKSILGVVVGFSIISFLHIVLGELAPKSLAIRKAKLIVMWVAIPLYYFYWLFFPFIWLLNHCALLILKAFGVKFLDKTENPYTVEELKLIISASHSHSEFQEEELSILENTLEFADLKAADLMRPIEDMVVININDDISKIQDMLLKNRYSRYPVIENESQNIIGILHVKDMFLEGQKNMELDLPKLIRPILTVSPDLPVVELFKKFKEGYSHFAIIQTDYHINIGFVTLDHILGALLGNIHDEFNEVQNSWIALNDGAFLMKGSTPVYALEKALQIELPDVKAHTISGLISEKLERLPEQKETIEFDYFSITVRKMKSHHILLVKITPKNVEEN